MPGGLLVLMLLIFGGLCLAHALRPTRSSVMAGASQGEGENDPGRILGDANRPGPRPTPALYARSGRSGDLLRASWPERALTVLGPTGAGVEQSAPALATQTGQVDTGDQS